METRASAIRAYKRSIRTTRRTLDGAEVVRDALKGIDTLTLDNTGFDFVQDEIHRVEELIREYESSIREWQAMIKVLEQK